MQVVLKVKVEVILSQLIVDYIGSVNISSLTGEHLSNITEDQIETKYFLGDPDFQIVTLLGKDYDVNAAHKVVQFAASPLYKKCKLI